MDVVDFVCTDGHVIKQKLSDHIFSDRNLFFVYICCLNE